MKNSIIISAEFYFKGEKFSPSMVVNLDDHIQTKSDFEGLYCSLANSNSIGLYSYEYEILLSTNLVFSDATGIAGDFLENGNFDLAAFEQALHDESIYEAIKKVAGTHFPNDDLSSQPNLKAALIEAYKLGQKSQ